MRTWSGLARGADRGRPDGAPSRVSSRSGRMTRRLRLVEATVRAHTDRDQDRPLGAVGAPRRPGHCGVPVPNDSTVPDDDAIKPPWFAGTRVEKETTPQLARLVLPVGDIGCGVSLGWHHAAGAAAVPKDDALTSLHPVRRTSSEQEENSTYARPIHDRWTRNSAAKFLNPSVCLVRAGTSWKFSLLWERPRHGARADPQRRFAFIR